MEKMLGSKSSGRVLVAVALLFLVGCATVGREFPVGPVAMIKIGETTQQEIRQRFGEPWRTGVEDGRRTWTYGHYRYSAFGADHTRDLVIRFDEQEEKVASFTFNSTYEEDRGI